MSMPQQPHAAFETCVHRKLCAMYAETECCVWLGMRLQYIACCWTDRPKLFPETLETPSTYTTGPNFASEICSRSTLVHLWEVVQIFQRESIFCSKISSGGPYLTKKLVPGGTNFGGSIFTMTASYWPIHHHGASLSKQQTVNLLLCHGTQQDLSLSTV